MSESLLEEKRIGAGTIYIASRVRHAPKWIEARSSGMRIISTWIDEAGDGETICMAELWRRCVDEALAATALVLYRENEEPLKGALVEVGAALGAGKPVFAVGFDKPCDLKINSFLHHPLVSLCKTLEDAFVLAGVVEASHA